MLSLSNIECWPTRPWAKVCRARGTSLSLLHKRKSWHCCTVFFSNEYSHWWATIIRIQRDSAHCSLLSFYCSKKPVTAVWYNFVSLYILSVIPIYRTVHLTTAEKWSYVLNTVEVAKSFPTFSFKVTKGLPLQALTSSCSYMLKKSATYDEKGSIKTISMRLFSL